MRRVLNSNIFYGNSQGGFQQVKKGGQQWNTYYTVVVVACIRGNDENSEHIK